MRKTSFLKKKLYVVVVGIALVVVVLGYVAYRFFINDEGLNAKEKDKVKRYKEYIVKRRNALNALVSKYDKMRTPEQQQLLNEATNFAFEDDIEKIDDPNTLLDIKKNKVMRAEEFVRDLLKLFEKPATQAAKPQTVAEPAKTQPAQVVQTVKLIKANATSTLFPDNPQSLEPDKTYKFYLEEDNIMSFQPANITGTEIKSRCDGKKNYIVLASILPGPLDLTTGQKISTPIYSCGNDYNKPNSVQYQSTEPQCWTQLQTQNQNPTDGTFTYKFCPSKPVSNSGGGGVPS